MGIRIFNDNFLDDAASDVTGSSESTKLPDDNVQHSSLLKPWRTGITVAAETIVVNLGSAQTIDKLMIFSRGGWTGYTSIEYQSNSADSWGAPPSISMTQIPGDSRIYQATPSSVTYQYWRFKFTKPTAATAADIGRLFVGSYTDFTEEVDQKGLDLPRKDNSLVHQTVGGARYTDIRPQYREFSAKISSMSQTSFTLLKAIAEEKGTHTPFWIQLDPNGSGISSEHLYVRFKDFRRQKVAGYDGGHLYDVTLSLVEEVA